VREHENIEVKTGALFTKLSHPVMSKLKIDCEGIEGFDVYPKTTPDLFKGSRLMLIGRFKGTGNHAIRLSGVVEGKEKTFVYEGSFPGSRQENDFIPTLWAQRKVAVLLDAIRLNGHNQELVSEIRRLGTEHGIVTPYTSHLVLEEGQKLSNLRGVRRSRDRDSGARGGFGGRGGGRAGPASPGATKSDDVKRVVEELRRAGIVGGKDAEKKVAKDMAERSKRERRSPKPADGRSGKSNEGASNAPTAKAKKRAAVDYSLALRTLSRSKNVQTGSGRASLSTRHIQGHTFHLIGGAWIDGKFAKGMEERVKKVVAFSDEYFELLTKHAELPKILAFSTRIVVVLGDLVLEIVPEK
jgi:hypothetical protein